MTTLSSARRLRTLLEVEDLAGLEQIATERHVEASHDLFEKGRGNSYIHIVLDGWVGRYQDFPDGRRQYLALHLSGDVCDLDRVMLDAVDFGAVALTSCTIARIELRDLKAAFEARPRLAMVFWRMLSTENAIACAWASSLGRRTAQESLAHLLCEVAVRLGGPTPANGSIFCLPLTHEDLANALGLSVVHVNRCVQSLRAERLIEVSHRQMRILNWNELQRIADFDPTYLRRDADGSKAHSDKLAEAASDAAALAISQDREASQLRRQLERREAELHELNHRIANGLQIASGLLARQRKVLSDPQGREALTEAQARLDAVGNLHRYLYRHSERLFGKGVSGDSASSWSVIQARDVDRAEPWPDGQDREEDQAISI
ncbi:MAG: helix-turn-helix domain-containing protein [Phenylobacterium sp.]|uniref:helix-turn-helix domain-containing protein n=1 Tax=Phenylobacterium sp. TaxID=1871053 RepID=UPI00273262FC|nr:helix-turn-helix domain-containing protein [Phenylobacterium sp.]MDP3175538.1 helix-turn-helix domain-containing protein [Phenylobacterium sp.]